MEAARTLQLMTDSVEARGDTLVVHELHVVDRTLAELVRRREREGIPAEETATAALEIGGRVLDREGTRAEVDIVKQEFTRASGEVERAFAERAQKVGDELQERLERFLGEDDGAVGKVLDSHAGALQELVAQHFGADRSTAVQHQLRTILERSMVESRQALLRQFSAEDGHNPLADFKAAVVREVAQSGRRYEDVVKQLAGLQGEIRLLHGAREAEQRLAEERDRGTSKGRSFEAQAFEILEGLASSRGDVAHHVGDERSAAGGKKGDVVIELDASSGPARGRIAVEVKDEKLSKNQAWAILNASLSQRDAGFAILVVASEDKVPSGREALHEYEGNKMIVTLDREDLDARGIELAYRYARCRCLMTLEKTLELDAPGVRDAAEEALSSLRDAQKIRTSLTGASNSVEAARSALGVMVQKVEASLQRIEGLITASSN